MAQVAPTETEPLHYYPTGEFISVPSVYNMNEVEYDVGSGRLVSYVSVGQYSLTNRWFVVVQPQNQDFYFGVIQLHGRDGEIRLEDAEFVSIPVGMPNIDANIVIDGDMLIASIHSVSELVYKLLVVHLDRENQYELYEGFDKSFHPIGLDGNILYSWSHTGPAVGRTTQIEEFNIETMERVALHCDADYDAQGVLAKDFDGSRMVLWKIRGSSFVVSLRGERVYLQLQGAACVNKICRNGIYYKFPGMKHFLYSTFDGETYSVNFEPNRQNVPGDESYISHVSDNGKTIWIDHGFNGDTAHFIKYKLHENRRQKSALSAAVDRTQHF